jgi:hypothetical protein
MTRSTFRTSAGLLAGLSICTAAPGARLTTDDPERVTAGVPVIPTLQRPAWVAFHTLRRAVDLDVVGGRVDLHRYRIGRRVDDVNVLQRRRRFLCCRAWRDENLTAIPRTRQFASEQSCSVFWSYRFSWLFLCCFIECSVAPKCIKDLADEIRRRPIWQDADKGWTHRRVHTGLTIVIFITQARPRHPVGQSCSAICRWKSRAGRAPLRPIRIIVEQNGSPDMRAAHVLEIGIDGLARRRWTKPDRIDAPSSGVERMAESRSQIVRSREAHNQEG